MAAVMEVSEDGTFATYQGPGIYRDGEFQAFAPQQQRPARAAPGQIGGLIAAAARRYSLDRELLTRLAWNESGMRPGAVSPKGAVGVMQLMDGTARDLGVDRYDLAQNIFGGAAYLRQLLDRYDGNTALALAAYNAGPESVDRAGGIPPFAETTAYVRAVLSSAPSKNPAPLPVLMDR